GILGKVAGVPGSLLIRSIEPEPELHLLVAPTAQNIVKPAPTFAFARQKRLLPQAVMPQLRVELAVVKVIGVLDVKTVAGEIVEEFPEFGGKGFIRQFVRRKQRASRALEFVNRALPTFRLLTGSDSCEFFGVVVGSDLSVHSFKPKRVGVT